MEEIKERCPRCGGAGQYFGCGMIYKKCELCNGSGYIVGYLEAKTSEVDNVLSGDIRASNTVCDNKECDSQVNNSSNISIDNTKKRFGSVKNHK